MRKALSRLACCLATALGVFVLLPAPAANALLLGTTVEVAYLYPNAGAVHRGPYDVAVGTDSTLTIVSNPLMPMYVDITDTQIVISMLSSLNGSFLDFMVDFNGFRFDFGGAIDLTGATLGLVTNFAEITAGDLAIVGNQVFLDFRGVAVIADTAQSVVIDITGLPLSAVPEPSTLLLLGGGLAGVAALRRRRAG